MFDGEESRSQMSIDNKVDYLTFYYNCVSPIEKEKRCKRKYIRDQVPLSGT